MRLTPLKVLALGWAAYGGYWCRQPLEPTHDVISHSDPGEAVDRARQAGGDQVARNRAKLDARHTPDKGYRVPQLSYDQSSAICGFNLAWPSAFRTEAVVAAIFSF